MALFSSTVCAMKSPAPINTPAFKENSFSHHAIFAKIKHLPGPLASAPDVEPTYFYRLRRMTFAEHRIDEHISLRDFSFVSMWRTFFGELFWFVRFNRLYTKWYVQFHKDLRWINDSMLEDLVGLFQERFLFDFNVLIQICRRNQPNCQLRAREVSESINCWYSIAIAHADLSFVRFS